jgi:WhiB family redox-sensing transcriptional regulator
MAADNRNTTDIFDIIADIVIARRAPWRDRAACKGSDPEMFFPKQTNPQGYAIAKKMCEQCSVQAECREDWSQMPAAMQRHGVWWGTTDRDRRALSKLPD